MTGWIIFGCIVLLLIILFRQSITVTVDYENKLDVKVKFLFFTIYPAKPKKKKKPKKEKAKKQKKQKKSADTVTDDNTEAPDSGEAAEAARIGHHCPGHCRRDRRRDPVGSGLGPAGPRRFQCPQHGAGKPASRGSVPLQLLHRPHHAGHPGRLAVHRRLV